MARPVSEKMLAEILEKIERFPNGASLEDISVFFSGIPKRTLQRYLSRLVLEGQLKSTSKGRALRYQLSEIKNEKGAHGSTAVSLGSSILKQVDKLIPLSPEALSIYEHIHQPIQARRPVGYKRTFLEEYRPNETFYLSETIRLHLSRIGIPSCSERLAGTFARQILNRLLIDLSWNSSRLEGNTYSLLETERLLELGEMSEGKDATETQMILNHKVAIEFLVDSADTIKYNSFTILNLHALLSDNLLRDPNASGRLRTQPIGIAKSVYQPLAIPQLINDCFQQILDTADAIEDPFEQSFFVMVQLPYLQPFLDVNKRVSRLAANISLIRNNLCPLSFVDVPDKLYISGLLSVYELNRIELLRDVFVWAYERSCALYSATRQELGDPDLFRLKYRNLIINTVGDIVRGCMDKSTAIAIIKQIANEAIEIDDRAHFVEVIENELMYLHKGNIARFRLKLVDYEKWINTWL